tara:strand:- start:2 stop:391 length:390 start_codon:yes stop_codon:yes gene_type:complete
MFFVLGQLPKNKPVSLVEPLPTKGVVYVRSSGSSASILKMNSLTGTALLKLPSGVKKVLSTYSIGSLGSVSLVEKKSVKIQKQVSTKTAGKVQWCVELQKILSITLMGVVQKQSGTSGRREGKQLNLSS